jgi:hypothetical protein
MEVKAHDGDDRDAPDEIELDRSIGCLLRAWFAEQAHGDPLCAVGLTPPRFFDCLSVIVPD